MTAHSPQAVVLILGLALSVACSEPKPEDSLVVEYEGVDSVVTRLIPLSKDHQPQWNERATLKERMEHYRVPGVGIAVIEGSEILWARGYGSMRAGGDVAVDENTLFHAGSIAKPVSAAAVLSLVERGVLDLDANVNDFLTSWKIQENDFTLKGQVTLRRLLSHSAGIEDGITHRSSADEPPNYLSPAGEKPSTAIPDILAGREGVDTDGPTRVTAVPGSLYRYANADYAIVELLVSDTTGTSFDSFMQTTILDPVGMISSTYSQPLREELRSRASIEHDFNGGALEGDRLHIPLLAAGGLWTTPSDLARYAIEIMKTYRGESDRLLSHAMAREMLAPQIEIPRNPIADAMALGFERSGTGPDFAILHTGGTWGSTAVLIAYPESGQGAVVMTNSATGSLLRFEILLAMSVEYGWPDGS